MDGSAQIRREKTFEMLVQGLGLITALLSVKSRHLGVHHLVGHWVRLL
jgi:hypothetical protein